MKETVATVELYTMPKIIALRKSKVCGIRIEDEEKWYVFEIRA